MAKVENKADHFVWDIANEETMVEIEDCSAALMKAWITGEYIEPRGSANHFSANNYGDRTEWKSDKGRTLSVAQLSTCPR